MKACLRPAFNAIGFVTHIYDKSFVCSLAERGRLPVETSNECRTYLLNYLKGVNRKINVASNCDLCLMNCCYADNTLYLVKFGRY